MPGAEKLKENLIQAAADVQRAMRELVESASTKPLSVDRVRELETDAHQATGRAGEAARILAKEREGGA